MAPQAPRLFTSEIIQKMAHDGLALLKKAAVPGEVVTKLLMTDPTKVKKISAEDALIAAGKVYEELQAVHNSLVQIIKSEKKKALKKE